MYGNDYVGIIFSRTTFIHGGQPKSDQTTCLSHLIVNAEKVVVDGSSSESARVRSGVPQGTVLGPLLFLTYINDLPSTVSSHVSLFADDCLLYRPIKCRADQEQLQRDLSALQDWADLWGMCFNHSKCSDLRVSRPK